MTRWFCLCMATAAIVGCSNYSPPEKPPEAKPAPEKPMSTVKTTAEAREELQARIDRCLGGQDLNDLFSGTMGIWAAGEKIQSLELVRVVQKYDTEGKIVPNQFVAAIKCVAANSITGKRESREFAITDFTFRDGAWQKPFER